MVKKEVNAYGCRCDKCGHEWMTRRVELPTICPKCKSKKWNRLNGYNNKEVEKIKPEEDKKEEVREKIIWQTQ